MVLVLADLLIIVSMLRDRLRTTNIYVSQQVLQNSFTLIIVGSYLLLLGILAKTAQYFETGRLLLDNAFFIFLAALGSAVLLLSEDVRLRIKRFIHHHFDRPTYDYREIWTTFTARTASLVDIKDICQAIARTVSETFGVSAVSIWLAEEAQSRPSLAASTALSESDHMGAGGYRKRSGGSHDDHAPREGAARPETTERAERMARGEIDDSAVRAAAAVLR